MPIPVIYLLKIINIDHGYPVIVLILSIINVFQPIQHIITVWQLRQCIIISFAKQFTL